LNRKDAKAQSIPRSSLRAERSNPESHAPAFLDRRVAVLLAMTMDLTLRLGVFAVQNRL
jgi:hypothetical protein